MSPIRFDFGERSRKESRISRIMLMMKAKGKLAPLGERNSMFQK